MIQVTYLQICMALLAVLLAGMLAGTRGALSAGLSSASCILPNLWFVLWLKMAERRLRYPNVFLAGRFFIGEFVKIAVTAGLLVAAVKVYSDMHWLAFLFGLVMAAQANFLAFWKKP